MSKNVEYPGYYKIPNTELYYKQFPIGVAKNGYDRFIEYLESKTENSKNFVKDAEVGDRTLREYCYRLYKMENGKFEEIETKTPLSAVNQNFAVDENGNLVLRSYGAALENVMMSGGDMLVSSDGEVLRETRGQMFIHSADIFGNYPTDVFVADRNDGRSKIVRIDHNFLDADGKLLSKEHFQKSNQPIIFPVQRTFHDIVDSKLLIDKNIYPTAYVYTDRDGAKLYPSAAALLMENRNEKTDGKEEIVSDESEYLKDFYNRLSKRNEIEEKLQAKGFSSKALKRIFRNEDILTEAFKEDFETESDLAFDPNSDKTYEN